MRATKHILTLLFVFTLAASAFAWTIQETTTKNLNAIDGISTTSMTTLCAVGNGRTILISNDYGANWSQTSIPVGMGADENVTDVSIVGNSIWIGTELGQVFVSSDAGGSWTDRTPAGAVFDDIHSIKFSSSNNGVVTGAKTGSFITYYTSNAGGGWSVASTPPGSTSMKGITATNANTFYIVGFSGKIFKSTDGGDKWYEQTSNTANNFYGIHFSSASTLDGYAVGRANTIRKTDDGGASWEVVTSTGIEDFYGVFFTSANTGEIVGVQNSGDTKGRIFSTANGGSSWTDEYTGANKASPLKDIYFTDTDNRFAVGTGAAGIILGNITAIDLASVVQAARTSQHQAYRGFSGDLTFTGTNFQRGPWATGDVDFAAAGITVQSVTRVSSTQLTVNITISGTAALGEKDVGVTNIDGTIANLTDGFTVTEKPIISTGLYPSSGLQGDIITNLIITGDFFQTGITNSSITFVNPLGPSGITVSNVTRKTTLEITCKIVIDLGATTGLNNVTVTNPDGGASDPKTFTVQSSTVTNPTITGISPTDVTIGATSVDVVLTGTEFLAGITAALETNGITINSLTRDAVTPTKSLTINIDVGANAHIGPRAITVLNTNGGAGTSADKNVYLNVMVAGAAMPTISRLWEDFGFQDKQGEDVIVYGSNFEKGATVIFYPPAGITVNSITFLNSTRLRVNIDIDSGAAIGSRDITVSNPTGAYRIKGGAYTIKQQNRANPGVEPGEPILFGPNPWNGIDPLVFQLPMDGPDTIVLRVTKINGSTIFKSPPIAVTAGMNKIPVVIDDIANGGYLAFAQGSRGLLRGSNGRFIKLIVVH